MTVRGVEIETQSIQTVSSPAAGVDEHTLRAACRSALSVPAGAVPAAATLHAPAPTADFPASAIARVMAQEAIREARTGRSPLRRIVLAYSHPTGYPEFASTVSGYVKHLVDVLIWGPMVTVDAIIQTDAGIVLVERRNPPLGLALPGGFVDYGESLEDAVRREAREETALELQDLSQVHTYSDPSRDPRFHTVTTVFSARAEGKPQAGDDAAAVRVVTPAELAGLTFAFDHGQIVEDWIRGRYRKA